MTKTHSLKQVQSRDKIKLKNIEQLEYKPYIVQDLGKFNPSFVQEEFEKFKQYVGVSLQQGC